MTSFSAKGNLYLITPSGSVVLLMLCSVCDVAQTCQSRHAPVSDLEHQMLLPKHTLRRASRQCCTGAADVASRNSTCDAQHAPKCPPERASSTSTRGMNGMELSCTCGRPAQCVHCLVRRRFTLNSLPPQPAAPTEQFSSAMMQNSSCVHSRVTI